jgi:hypothetical protein
MTIYLGDFAAGATIYIPFHTFNSSGASVTITGLAVTDIEVYKNGSTTQRASDAGYTLLDTDGIDFDGLTGIHGFSINTGDNTDSGFYASGADYWVVVSAITVDSQTVSFVAATFSIENRSALRPTTAGRTLDVASTGEAGLDFNNVNIPVGAIPGLGIVDNGTAQSATGTTLVLRSAAAFANDELIGATILITGGSAGVGQSRVITDYVSSTDTATVDTWTTTPSGTITYVIYAGSPASTSLVPNVNVTQISGDSTAADNLEAVFDGTGANMAIAALTVSAGVAITQSTSNASGLTVTGNGTGHGAVFTSGSGATGQGIRVVAASTNGSALLLSGSGTGAGLNTAGGATGHGIAAVGGATSGDGINSAATTSGHGITATGVGTTKHGVNAAGGSTSSHGISATGGGTGSGISATSGSGATGNGITATSAATAGDGIAATGNGTGNGMTVTSGSGATGAAIRAVAASTNGSALSLAGSGTGSGISAAAGASGNGITALGGGAGHGISTTGGLTGTGLRVIGGGTSGAGIAITTTSGDGIQSTPTAGHAMVLTANGTSKHGAVITGGTAGTSDGLKLVAGSGGLDLRGDITQNAMVEAYAADGSAPTLAQALFLTMQSVGEVSVSGTTMTVKKLDGTTTAATYTLDSSTAPTSRTRAS